MEQEQKFASLEDVQAQAAAMQRFYETGVTRDLKFRRVALIALRNYLKANEDELLAALQMDLGKAPFEGYATELGIVYDEIRTCLDNLGKWARPKSVPTPLVHFLSSSKVHPMPLGVVLVEAPWNYPLQLALVPLVDAIAAGNCVAVKPSRTSHATSAALLTMLENIFQNDYICGFPGSDDMNGWLMQTRWDLIFFTGSPAVGRTIMEAASKSLTPVVLELGGKSPCIVHSDANIKRAAQRIAWGKGLNCGQTCVAPDYLLVHESIADNLVAQLDQWFHAYYGPDTLRATEWPHMINEHHFDRIMGLIANRNDKAEVVFGGNGDRASLRIEPTCIVGVTLDDPVMNEEIFGPVLPIITYQTLEEAFAIVRRFEKPLATYVFSDNPRVQKAVVDHLPSGGTAINDTVIHAANNNMPFGGVGASGMGAYHGKAGFDAFTHYKAVTKKNTVVELPLRNPPFDNKIELLRLFMR